GFDVAPEQLVDQVLRRQRMTHHPPAELDRLELLFLWAQLGRLGLETPRRVHQGGGGRVHETERRRIGRGGERRQGCRRRRGRVGSAGALAALSAVGK